MAIASQLIFLGVFMICCFFIYRHFKLRKQLAGIPSPRSQPFFGHIPIIKPDIEGYVDQIMGMAQLYPEYPRIVLFWMGPMPTLMIYSARLVECVCSTMQHLDKGMAYDMIRPWLGNGLVTKFVSKLFKKYSICSYAEPWRARRKLLTPTFHYEILKNFLHIFNDQARILVDKLHLLSKENKCYFLGYLNFF